MMRVLRTLIALGLCGGLSVSCGAPPAANAPETPAREEDSDASPDAPAGDEAESGVVSEIPEKKPSSLRDEPATVEEAERMFADELGRLESMFANTQLMAGSCVNACRALSSMERSVVAICELAGEGDDRCKRARAKLDGAKTRVASAQCTCDR